MINVESVNPETGLFEEPMTPTRFPETVAKKNPTRHHQAGHIYVQDDHQCEYNADQTEDGFRRHVALRARHRFEGRRSVAHFRERSTEARRQVLAHSEKRIGGAHHHSSDRDGSHDVSPHGGCLIDPSFIQGRTSGLRRDEMLQLRTEEIHEQRDQQSPGEHAAGEVERGELESDDVADAKIGRAHGRRGDGRNGAGLEKIGAADGPHAHDALTEFSDADDEIFVDRV
jgi:hypothetical protein